MRVFFYECVILNDKHIDNTKGNMFMSNQRTVTGLGSGTNLCLSELARKSWNFDDVFCGLGEGLQNCISVHVRIPQHKGVHTSPRMVLVLNPVAMLSGCSHSREDFLV